jgi:hypothetical protein
LQNAGEPDAFRTGSTGVHHRSFERIDAGNDEDDDAKMVAHADTLRPEPTQRGSVPLTFCGFPFVHEFDLCRWRIL